MVGKLMLTLVLRHFVYCNRSVVVKLECGQENEIVSVDEPSTCEYVMMVRSPLACTREELTRAQQDFAFWNKP